nr:SUKH-4 family immunity protein [Allonocardiopsis opalescens]
MGGRVKYPESWVAHICNEETRVFLEKVGVPGETFIFRARRPDIQPEFVYVDTQNFTIIGDGATSQVFCVAEDGAVVAVNLIDRSVRHVNADVVKFARCLDYFMDSYPFGSVDVTREELEVIAGRLMAELMNIDHTVSDGDAIWEYVVHDVAIGDYVDE